jgi:uncharacterized membrane protein
MTLALTQDARVRAVPATAMSAQRLGFVDAFRGLLIAHMALDHASLMFNAARGGEELAAAPPHLSSDIFQFLTRFTGVPVAPAFCFMAGFMIALTSIRREARGVSHRDITRRLVIRGLVLIAVDALIMGLPRTLMGFYSFMVLSSIGVGIIVVALLRDLPTKIILPAALAVLLLHPLIDVSALPVALRAVLYEPIRDGVVRSLYPVIPWGAIVLVGFVAGRDAVARTQPARLWLALTGICLVLFFGFRLHGGYGNAYPYSSVASLEFWSFAKYPPDIPFLAWSFAATFLSLAVFWSVSRTGTPAVLRPLEVFGRVPFFFYVVHFFVLGIAAAIVGTKVDLGSTYALWLVLLLAMAWPSSWYYRKKRERPNFITRYV